MEENKQPVQLDKIPHQSIACPESENKEKTITLPIDDISTLVNSLHLLLKEQSVDRADKLNIMSYVKKLENVKVGLKSMTTGSRPDYLAQKRQYLKLLRSSFKVRLEKTEVQKILIPLKNHVNDIATYLGVDDTELDIIMQVEPKLPYKVYAASHLLWTVKQNGRETCTITVGELVKLYAHMPLSDLDQNFGLTLLLTSLGIDY